MPRTLAPRSRALRHVYALPLLMLVVLGGCAQAGSNRTAIIRCTPGERVDVSCGCLGIGTACEGTAGIRLCDPTLANGACEDAQAVTRTDDRDVCDVGSEDCPLATAFCPSSGMLGISTFARPDFLDRTGPYTCTWGVRRSSLHTAQRLTFACQNGERVQASCGCRGLGRACEGDPVMYACGAGGTCTDRATSLAYDDDECGRCPFVEATCPADGAISIATAPLSSGSRYRCEFGAIGSVSGVLVPMGI